MIVKKKYEKIVLGWRENVSIPDLGIKEIKAKVDSGARTSALHVTQLKIITKGSHQYAEFMAHPKQRSSQPEIFNRKKIISFKKVKSSNGKSENRPMIEVEIVLGQQRRSILLSLTNRDLMGFRFLLGREAVKGPYLIDPKASFLLRKKLTVDLKK